MSEKTLFVVAAGLSTRFNGKPKHLAKVKGLSSIENTLMLAHNWYSSIYVVLNEKASKETIEETNAIASTYGAKQILIPSGKGDADAVFQALKKSSIDSKCISVCWGDAWFKNDKVFKTASQALEDEDYSSAVFDAMCSMEEHPYGWFSIDSIGTILKAEFASDPGAESLADGAYAVHDQCFFNINASNFKQLYEAYASALESEVAAVKRHLVATSAEFKMSLKYEISWYKMINWCRRFSTDLHSTATILDEPVAMSFNTKEELEKIENAQTSSL